MVSDGAWEVYSTSQIQQAIPPATSSEVSSQQHGAFAALWTSRHIADMRNRGLVFGRNIVGNLSPGTARQAIFPCPLGWDGENVTNGRRLGQITGMNFNVSYISMLHEKETHCVLTF